MGQRTHTASGNRQGNFYNLVPESVREVLYRLRNHTPDLYELTEFESELELRLTI
jgi:hypothetical protein